MRRSIIVAGVMLVSALSGTALASGPSGSNEDGNDVKTCGSATPIVLASYYAGTNGVETCNDGSGAFPLQGRIIVATAGYVAADGDKDNPAEAQGWTRVDGTGVHRCSAPSGSADVTAGTCDGGTVSNTP
jgi:hypothetical protein